MLKSELDILFKTNKNSNFIFVKPGGNYGDNLIYMGAEKLAKKYSLSVQTLDHNVFLSSTPEADCIIYIHGSGGYNPWCSNNAAKCLKHALKSDAFLTI